MSKRKKFIERVRSDKAYEAIYTFITKQFLPGEIISEQIVIDRYLAKQVSRKQFTDWDVSSLFDGVIKSLLAEGKVRQFPGKIKEYLILKKPEKAIDSEEKTLE